MRLLARNAARMHKLPLTMHCMRIADHCLNRSPLLLNMPHVTHAPCSTEKVKAAWTPEMEAEATRYYLTNYISEPY